MRAAPLRYVAVLAVALTGCSQTGLGPGAEADGATPVVAASAEQIDEMERAAAEVAAAQREADQQLAGVVGAVRELDTAVGALREPEQIDRGREVWPSADAAFQRAQVDQLRQRYVALAEQVDAARLALREVAAETAGGTWEARYLASQDASLEAVRTYAERTDVLVRALLTHWETYAALHAGTTSFFDQRWVHRSGEEAADAYEAAVGGAVRGLEAAQAEVGAALEQREQAAQDVNETAEETAEIWAQRDASATGG